MSIGSMTTTYWNQREISLLARFFSSSSLSEREGVFYSRCISNIHWTLIETEKFTRHRAIKNSGRERERMFKGEGEREGTRCCYLRLTESIEVGTSEETRPRGNRKGKLLIVFLMIIFFQEDVSKDDPQSPHHRLDNEQMKSILHGQTQELFRNQWARCHEDRNLEKMGRRRRKQFFLFSPLFFSSNN